MLRSYADTTYYDDAEIVFRTDNDDKETYEFLMRHTNHRVLVGPRLDGYQSMPVFFNQMAQAATGDVLLCGNDDMIFRTVDWVPMVLAETNKYSDGLFDIGVRTHNETHFPFSIVSKTVVERLGFLWDPRIFWGDIFLRDVMAAFGRAVMLPTVAIDHDWAGNAPDEVFREADKDIIRRVPDYWTRVHARAVHEAVARLREVAVA